uniref:MARVEL domain-containing protein n=1 Tax=Panagrellus redivivus TaxID=6233 RepID=A0A7E4V3C6_PANRE
MNPHGTEPNPHLDTPAKERFYRPTFLEPVNTQLLQYSRKVCRYTVWASTTLLVVCAITIPGIFFASCSITSIAYDNVELFIAWNAVAYVILTPMAVHAAKVRDKNYFIPIIMYTLSVCIFLIVPITLGLDCLDMHSTLLSDTGVSVLFVIMEGLVLLAFLYFAAYRSIDRCEEYDKTGVLLI